MELNYAVKGLNIWVLNNSDLLKINSYVDFWLSYVELKIFLCGIEICSKSFEYKNIKYF